jgi:hypothetical protein
MKMDISAVSNSEWKGGKEPLWGVLRAHTLSGYACMGFSILRVIGGSSND